MSTERMRALLFARGHEARSKDGAIHLFDVELARLGTLPSSHDRLLAGLQRPREIADYDAAVELRAADAQGMLDDARAFFEEARRWLRAVGWLEDDGS